MARVALDAFGSDHAPEQEVKGALLFVEKTDNSVILVGDEKKLRTLVPPNAERVEIVNAPEKFGMGKKPTEVLRAKESSMTVSAQLVKDGKADGFVSAGNTGALLVLGTFVLGRLKGIERPAIATVIPSRIGGTVLIDSGANASLKPHHYIQLASMGIAYTKGILKKAEPTVGLLNVGTEEEKGTDIVKEAHALLKERLGGTFAGNVEGRDVCFGEVDVVVCDGFNGNVVLKTVEGLGAFISKSLKDSIKSSNLFQKIGALMMKGTFDKFKGELDYRKHGGAFLLGVNGAAVKAHGSSDATAIFNALRVAAEGIENGVVDIIERSI